jgi:hypothetical protein
VIICIVERCGTNNTNNINRANRGQDIEADRYIEWLFNSARDICHYHRGSLKPKTIKELMLFMYTTKFNMNSE